MRARLFTKSGPMAGASFEIGIDSAATIGRAADNTIVLTADLVSGHHARITFDAKASCFLLEDLGSRNGTFLAGLRVREPEKLGRLDVINFAGVLDFVFQELGDAVPAAVPAASAVPAKPAKPAAAVSSPLRPPPAVPTPPPLPVPVAPPLPANAPGGTQVGREDVVLPAVLAAAAEAAAKPAVGGTQVGREDVILPAVLAAVSAASEAAEKPAAGGTQVGKEELVLPTALAAAAAAAALAEPAAPPPVARFTLAVEREGGEATFDLAAGEHVVGRSEECDVRIDDRSLSRKHARLVVRGDLVFVIDLGSTNRTLVGDRRAEPDEATVVAPGAELTFGSVKARMLRAG